MKLHRIAAFAAAIAVTTPVLPALAQGAPPSKQDEASARFKKGIDLFKDGDYQAALIEFRRAYELAPNYNVLYNIGQVYFQLQDYPNALRTLEKYVEEGGKNIPAQRKADVDKDLEKLKARVANLEIITAIPDAEISIDDVAVGKSPLAKPVLVSAGKHKITISKQGFTPVSKVVEIASSESLKVTLDPVEGPKAGPQGPGDQPPPPPGGANEPPKDQPEPPKQTKIPWAGIVITGGLTIGAVITGVLALKASGDLATMRDSANASREGLDDAKTKTQTFALVTDILTGGAVVALGVTIYVGVSSNRDKKPDAPPAAPGPGGFYKPTIRAAGYPGGMMLIGKF